jgi:hypothetical protein
MKIAAYHKARGDTVKLIGDFTEHFDAAYCSKTFNLPSIRKIPALPGEPNADAVYKGGTGFAIGIENGRERYDGIKDPPLPGEIERICPDYGLYPHLTRDTAFGFLTRGCPNACGFCVVCKKEG